MRVAGKRIGAGHAQGGAVDIVVLREGVATAAFLYCVIGAIVISLVGCERRAMPDDFADREGADPQSAFTDPFNASYVIDGQEVALLGGRAEQQVAPGSATRTLTTVLGQPVFGDLDGDADQDAGVVLLRDGGGSGRFYYLAAALNEDGRFRGTNAVLLGDRIALGETGIRDGVLTAHFAERGAGEPMSAEPDVPRSVSAVVTGSMLQVIDDESPREIAGRVVLGHEASEDGFGASYDAGFVAEAVVDIAATGDCQVVAGD